MKPLILALFLALLSSCSAVSDFVENKEGTRQCSKTDYNAFGQYLARFEEVGRAYTKNPEFQIGSIPVCFGDTENPRFDGVCFSYASGKKEIVIKKSWWDQHSTLDENGKEDYSLIRESLLFHELGHCRLGRKHDEELLGPVGHGIQTTRIKKSMMSHNIVSSENYRKYKEGYWEELFTEETTELETLIQQP